MRLSCALSMGCLFEHLNLIVYFTELPKPSLGDLSDLRALSAKKRREKSPNILGFTFRELCELDTVKVELLPEKKGLILKHVEYEITSQVNTTHLHVQSIYTGPHSLVGKVSDCRSRGREIDPSLVPYFCGD